MKAIVLALGLVTIAGCADPDGPIYVDKNFTADEQVQIYTGIQIWPIRTQLIFGADVAYSDSPWARREIIRGDPEMVDSSATHDTKGTTGGGRIVVRPEYPRLAHSVAHEFGHVLGLEHVTSDPTALMYFMAEDGMRDCISHADADEFYRVHGYGVKVTCTE